MPPQTIQIPVRGPRLRASAEPGAAMNIPPYLKGRRHAISASSSAYAHGTPASWGNEASPVPFIKKSVRKLANNPVKQPVKNPTSFLSLPFELRERIMVESYEMTIKELPASHPKIHNEALDMSPAAVYHRTRRPPAVTVHRNPVPPATLKCKKRKTFLWRNPGQWGPVFQVMYTCKQLYYEGRAIRYRHIRVIAYHLDHLELLPVPVDDSLLIDRLSYPIIQFCTREVAVTIAQRQHTITIKNLVEALGKLKSLRHLFVIVNTDLDFSLNSRRWGSDADLLLFFDLKIETLTIDWDWKGGVPRDLEVREEYAGLDGEESWVTVAGRTMVNRMDHFRNTTFKKSRWYTDPDVLKNTDKVAPGEVMKHAIQRATQSQFYFAPAADRNLTTPPKWIKNPSNPYNHPDQKKRTLS